MKKKTQREVFSPGEFIRDELEARGWTQNDLAAIMGRPLPTINEIITGKKVVTPETAIDLSKAFGTSPELWLNLESAYRLSLVKSDGDDDIARKAEMFKIAPVNEMVKRHWISSDGSAGELEKDLLRFYDIASLVDKPTLTWAARKSTTYDAATPEQVAWACRVRNLAKAVSAVPFNPRSFENGLESLRAFVGHEANVRKLPAFLASIGIRLVIVEYLPRMKMDGVTLWLNDKSPVVGLSMRFDRIDYFWFTLMHELIHVKYRDGFSFDERLAGEESVATSEKPEAEQRADTEAAQFLVPTAEMDGFIARVAPLFYRPKINQFANRLRVHPGIIVGQLQRRGVLHYSQQREFLVKVRDTLIPNAMADGWGFSPKV